MKHSLSQIINVSTRPLTYIVHNKPIVVGEITFQTVMPVFYREQES